MERAYKERVDDSPGSTSRELDQDGVVRPVVLFVCLFIPPIKFEVLCYVSIDVLFHMPLGLY